jgi:hypothetical protein
VLPTGAAKPPDAVVEESNLSYHVFAIRKALGNGRLGGRHRQRQRIICNVVELLHDSGNLLQSFLVSWLARALRPCGCDAGGYRCLIFSNQFGEAVGVHGLDAVL